MTCTDSPKQNRVTPFGEIIATPAYGTLLGNRGRLHNDDCKIKRLSELKRWIYCRVELKESQKPRPVMPKNSGYTALFFLDEATALAAGHRPCLECSRPRYNEFMTAWKQANNPPVQRVPELDTILHQERFDGQQQKTYLANLDDLPTGTFVTFVGNTQAYLVLDDVLLPWQPAGYGQGIVLPNNEKVRVLTPISVVKMLHYFQPRFHPSANKE